MKLLCNKFHYFANILLLLVYHSIWKSKTYLQKYMVK